MRSWVRLQGIKGYSNSLWLFIRILHSNEPNIYCQQKKYFHPNVINFDAKYKKDSHHLIKIKIWSFSDCIKCKNYTTILVSFRELKKKRKVIQGHIRSLLCLRSNFTKSKLIIKNLRLNPKVTFKSIKHISNICIGYIWYILLKLQAFNTESLNTYLIKRSFTPFKLVSNVFSILFFLFENEFHYFRYS